MPRVTWSETLALADEASVSVTNTANTTGGTTKDTSNNSSRQEQSSFSSYTTRKSSLKPASVGNKKKEKKKKKKKKKKDDGAEAWRDRGKLHRAKLIMKDEESGGDAFVLSDDCNIEKYYDVAERVLEQFLGTTVEDKKKLTEAYLVGNRLVKFMSRVLPTHKDYFSADPRLIQMRVDSQSQLIELLQYLEELALIIDEEEYQEFIRMNLSVEEPPSFRESDTSVSSYELAPYGEEPLLERPSFTADAAAQMPNDSSSEPESRLRRLQVQDSQSWDTAYSQISPPMEPEQKTKTTNDSAAPFDVEWSPTFTADFGESSAHLLPGDFADSNTWFSPQQADSRALQRQDLASEETSTTSWVRHDVDRGATDSFTQQDHALERMTLNIPALGSSREDLSPKSVLELPGWKWEEEDCASTAPNSSATTSDLEGYLQIMKERAPPSDDEFSMVSGEEEELSLTGAGPPRRRRSLKHFRGCVKCLLE